MSSYNKSDRSGRNGDGTSSPSFDVSKVKSVVIDSLVVMKILKHARENPHESVQGPLLGLVSDNNLDVTNCFPYLVLDGDDGDEDSEERGSQYQIEMMRWLREVNVDHMGVGWYQVTELESFYEEQVVSTHFEHQSTIEESIFLIYDPVQTAQGSLCLKAFRLTDAAMKAFNAKDYSPAALRRLGLTYRTVMEEIPVVVRTSPLAKALVAQLNIENRKHESYDRLDIAPATSLEKDIEKFMGCVDDLSQETVKYSHYVRHLSRQQQSLEDLKRKRQMENIQRQEQGLPLLPEIDASNAPNIKTVTPPPRLDAILLNAQIDSYCKQIGRLSSQNSTKLYLAKSVQTSGDKEAAEDNA